MVSFVGSFLLLLGNIPNFLSAPLSSPPPPGICENAQGSIHSINPYTGFKINRNYEVRHSQPPILHYVALAHCYQGGVEYEQITATDTETDIDWAQPVCLIVPPKMRNRLANKHRREHPENAKSVKLKDSKHSMLANKETKSIFGISLKDFPKLPHTYKPVHLKSKLLPNIEALTKRMFDYTTLRKRSNTDAKGQDWRHFLAKLSGRFGFLEYHSSDVSNVNVEHLEPINYKDLKPADSENVVCYKFARRKRYALRESSIYAPFTWVGGIFDCQISKEDQLRYIEQLSDSNDEHESFEVECDEDNATPVGPLIADGFSLSMRDDNFHIWSMLRVPYLYTPGSLGLRFGSTAELLELSKASHIYNDHIRKDSTDDLDYDAWWKEIRLQEDYNYTSNDLNTLTRATTKTYELVEQFQNKMPSSVWKGWAFELPERSAETTSISYLEQKLFYMLSKLKNREPIISFTKNIQSIWDDMRLSVG